MLQSCCPHYRLGWRLFSWSWSVTWLLKIITAHLGWKTCMICEGKNHSSTHTLSTAASSHAAWNNYRQGPRALWTQMSGGRKGNLEPTACRQPGSTSLAPTTLQCFCTHTPKKAIYSSSSFCFSSYGMDFLDWAASSFLVGCCYAAAHL